MSFLRSSSLPRHRALLFSPWLLVGFALILALAIGFWAVKNTRQERENMVRNLVERAGALMWAMEGGARAGMGMQSTASYLQFMLEETAKQPDIVYMAVITRQGEVVAHSDRSRIGQQFYPPDGMEGVSAQPAIDWRMLRTRDKQRVFEAYRLFTPLPGFPATKEQMGHGHDRHGRGGHRMGRMMAGRAHGMRPAPFQPAPIRPPFPESPPAPSAGIQPPPSSDSGFAPEAAQQPENENDLVIVIGLDMAAYDNALVAGERSTLFTALLVGLLGLGGFTSLYWAQGYKLSRRMLLDTKAYAEEVMNSLPLGLVIFDSSGRVAQVNGVAESLLGRRAEELMGRPVPEVQGEDWVSVAARVGEGEAVLEEEHNLVPASEKADDRKAIPVSLSASRILNEEGEGLGLLFLLRDLREVKRLRAELRRSERLSTLGNMAARVAHEIRNPLSSIKGFATYLGSRHNNDADRDAARTMIGEVDRLNRVVSELLDFARPANLAIAPTELGELLARATRLAAMDAESKGVALTLHPSASAEPIMVAVDAERITQALLNLLLNAVQATDSGGNVSLGTLPSEGGRVALTIRDTGRGMTPEVLAQVFNPYFTTRASGTGLGLSIVSRIVEDHGGEIRMSSTPGKGTTVTLWLPLAGEALPENSSVGGKDES